MKKDFSYWYRLKFNQLDATPPKEVWENISNELDRDEVWIKVNKELEAIARRKTIYRSVTYLSIFLFLFALGGLFLFYQTDFKTASLLQLTSGKLVFNKASEKNVGSSIPQIINQKSEGGNNGSAKPFSYNNEQKNVTENLQRGNATFSETDNDNAQERLGKKKNKILNLRVKNENSTKKRIYKIKNTSKKSVVKNESNFKNIIIPESYNLKNIQTQNEKYSLSNSDTKKGAPKAVSVGSNEPVLKVFDSTLVLRKSSAPLSLMVPLQVIISEERDSVKSVKLLDLKKYTTNKHLIIGSSFTLANSWLLNSDTYNGFDKDHLNQTVFSFGNAYTTLVGYSLSNKYTLQIEWLINNKQEQGYIIYCEGKQLQKQIKINYTNLNLLIKQKGNEIVFKNRWPLAFNYITGVQYGVIKSIAKTVNDKTKSIGDKYKKNNYSVILGAESQLRVSQVWLILAGIRADIGLRNIYSGTSAMPASFNRTYNSSLGFNIGLNYIIPIKF